MTINGKIYMITNSVTGHRYIGQTVNSIESRFKKHLDGTRRAKKLLSKPQLAMESYGKRNFSVKLIEDKIDDIDRLIVLEQFYIKKYGTIEEYNGSTGGETPLSGHGVTKKSPEVEVNIDNRFKKMNFRDFTKTECNLWWSLFSLIEGKGATSLFVYRNDIEEIANTKLANKDFYKTMLRIKEKLSKINTNLEEDELGVGATFNPFVKYEVTDLGLNIKLSDCFYDWFNQVGRKYTKLNLTPLMQMKSCYAIDLYRFLSSNIRLNDKRNKEYSLTVDISTFKLLMRVPSSYNVSNMKRKVINPAVKEILTWGGLKTLDVNYVLKRGTKKKVVGIEFRFYS